MLNICRSDLYRLLRSKSFYIMLGVILLILILSVAAMEPGVVFSIGLQKSDVSEAIEGVPYETYSNFSFKQLRNFLIDSPVYYMERDFLSQNMNLYYMFIIIAVVTITSDFSNGSVKNTLSSAISRRKYYMAKTGFTAVLSIAILFFNLVLLHCGMKMFNSSANTLSFAELMKIYVFQLPVALTLVSLLVCLSFTFRKTAIINGLGIPFIIVFQLILVILKEFAKLSDKFTDYELSSMYYFMAHSPSSSYVIKSFIICGVLILAFNIAGYTSFRKAEIR
ncbi:ABC transporter permease subunit [uncultured Ruminococcus sp.]|uniref:ABC transporter permease subunit n=1 Tax=uncultured Ruminococcus sp. TaxID=165186 RepID=UPI0026179CB5|nr:ABC transporter permease subunit [uncultured Ruminococcus sp.]